MRFFLSARVLFVHSIGIGKADPNIYGPGGVNFGPTGNPLTQKQSNSRNSNTQNMITPHTGQFVEGDISAGYTAKILFWGEHTWRYSGSGNLEQNAVQEERRMARIESEKLKEIELENQELAYTTEESNNSEVVNFNLNSDTKKQNSPQGAINPITGEYYAPAGNGAYVGTRDGTVYAPGGPHAVVNTITGEVIPTQ